MINRRRQRSNTQIHTNDENTSEERAGIRRRSPCLDPQIHASEEGVHLQIQATEIGVGVTHRHRPHVHHQINASEDGFGVTGRRRRRSSGTSPTGAASLPDDDDMLREILLRLPPQPSSLPRVSAVCKRWRGLVTDPKFHRQLYAHHRKPPILGVFYCIFQRIVFSPILDRPDRIPPQRFNFGCSGIHDLLDCRHGVVLARDRASQEAVVCDPITGEQRRVAIPSELMCGYVKGAVLCAAGGHLGHVHGGCHLSSYKVVLVSTGRSSKQPVACVYSLDTGVCGNLISRGASHELFYGDSPPTLVGNVLYWLFWRDRILEFDLDTHNLAVTVGPPVKNKFHHGNRRIILAEGGAVGFAIFARSRFQMWQKKVSCQSVATWVPWKTIEMHNILGLSFRIKGQTRWLLGYDEDNDVIFVYLGRSVYTLQLKSMESNKLYETNCVDQIHPFTSFYAPGTTINGGSNGAEMLQKHRMLV